MTEELKAKVEKLEAENEKLKAKVKAAQAENAELQEQRRKDVVTIASLKAKVANAEAKASGLEKLLARDGPHDPVSKYD